MKRCTVLLVASACLFWHWSIGFSMTDMRGVSQNTTNDNEMLAANNNQSIQGEDAGGAKQMTVIDANGNLKIVDTNNQGAPSQNKQSSPSAAILEPSAMPKVPPASKTSEPKPEPNMNPPANQQPQNSSPTLTNPNPTQPGNSKP